MKNHQLEDCLATIRPLQNGSWNIACVGTVSTLT